MNLSDAKRLAAQLLELDKIFKDIRLVMRNGGVNQNVLSSKKAKQLANLIRSKDSSVSQRPEPTPPTNLSSVNILLHLRDIKNDMRSALQEIGVDLDGVPFRLWPNAMQQKYPVVNNGSDNGEGSSIDSITGQSSVYAVPYLSNDFDISIANYVLSAVAFRKGALIYDFYGPEGDIEYSDQPVDDSEEDLGDGPRASIFVYDNNLVEYESGSWLTYSYGDDSYSKFFIYRVWAIKDESKPNGLRFVKDNRTEISFNGVCTITQYGDVSEKILAPGEWQVVGHNQGNEWFIDITHYGGSTLIERQPEDGAACKFTAFGATSPKIYWGDKLNSEYLTADLLFNNQSAPSQFNRYGWMNFVDYLGEVWCHLYGSGLDKAQQEVGYQENGLPNQLLGYVFSDGTYTYTVMDQHYNSSFYYLLKPGSHAPYRQQDAGPDSPRFPKASDGSYNTTSATYVKPVEPPPETKSDAGDVVNPPAPKYPRPTSGPYWSVSTLGPNVYGATAEECWALAVMENNAVLSHENQQVHSHYATASNGGVQHDVELDGDGLVVSASSPNRAVGTMHIQFGEVSKFYVNEVPPKPDDKTWQTEIDYWS